MLDKKRASAYFETALDQLDGTLWMVPTDRSLAVRHESTATGMVQITVLVKLQPDAHAGMYDIDDIELLIGHAMVAKLSALFNDALRAVQRSKAGLSNLYRI